MGCKPSKSSNFPLKAIESDAKEKNSPENIKFYHVFRFGMIARELFTIREKDQKRNDYDFFEPYYYDSGDYKWKYRPWFWNDPETDIDYFEIRVEIEGHHEGVIDFAYLIRIRHLKEFNKSITEVGLAQIRSGEEVVLGRKMASDRVFFSSSADFVEFYQYWMNVQFSGRPARMEI